MSGPQGPGCSPQEDAGWVIVVITDTEVVRVMCMYVCVSGCFSSFETKTSWEHRAGTQADKFYKMGQAPNLVSLVCTAVNDETQRGSPQGYHLPAQSKQAEYVMWVGVPGNSTEGNETSSSRV